MVHPAVQNQLLLRSTSNATGKSIISWQTSPVNSTDITMIPPYTPIAMSNPRTQASSKKHHLIGDTGLYIHRINDLIDDLNLSNGPPYVQTSNQHTGFGTVALNLVMPRLPVTKSCRKSPLKIRTRIAFAYQVERA